jgi:hypothetical protein
VHELRDVEELLPPDHDVPVGLEPGIAHERDERVEDLGDAAAERRRAYVQDALALEGLGQLVYLVDETVARSGAGSHPGPCDLR